VVAFWERVAACETGKRWTATGPTYVGGLGIYRPNWPRWARQLGIYTEASATSRLDQIRVADWAYRHERAWWGCFAVTGRPPS
jgi:hypothetical protein